MDKTDFDYKIGKWIIPSVWAFAFQQGGISFNAGGSIFTSWMWKLSPGKLPFPRTWKNKEMDIF